MKNLAIFLFALLSCSSCKKTTDVMPATAVDDHTASAAILTEKSGGSGSGGGNNNGGGTAPTGLISGVGVLLKHVGGFNDSIFISLTQAGVAGTFLTLTSSNASLHVPATYAIPAGAFGFYVPVNSSVVSTTTTATVTASLQGQSKTSAVFKIFPLHAMFPAPQLQSPGNGASFKNRLQVTFTWSANANAYYHDIQISDNSGFTNTPILELYTDDPTFVASYFNGIGIKYWRVRYIDGSGGFGPWSATRNFEIKN